MRILIGMESSGTIRDALLAKGHDAWSCDLLPTDKPGPHYQCDVMEVVGNNWDAAIFHPECTYLCSSGLHWNKRDPERAKKTEASIAFVEKLWALPLELICIENPIGCLSTKSNLGKPSQIVQPYWFGDDASKSTCLWTRGLPLLQKTNEVAPRIVGGGLKRWGNQTDSGQNKLAPSPDRWKERSKTYEGLAQAIAEQWFL